MYKKVSGIKFWLLGYITFGIYPLVVWARMSKQQNKMAEAVGEKKIMGFVAAWFLGLITCSIVSIVWMFKFFGQMSKLNNAKEVGIVPGNAFVMFLMSCIPFYSFFWLAGAHNKLIAAYENN